MISPETVNNIIELLLEDLANELSPEEIAHNVKNGVSVFSNIDNTALKMQYINSNGSLIKAFSSFTGAIAIKITGIYDLLIDTTLEISIEEKAFLIHVPNTTKAS